MHFSRVSRKKRKVSLLPVHPPQKTRRLLIAMWRPSPQNGPWLERNWYESVYRSHAAFCSCGDCAGHLSYLAANLGRPPSAQAAPQQLPPAIRALPALPAPQGDSGNRAPWPGAGGDAADDGDPGDRADADGGAGGPADEDLLAAFDLAEE